MVADDHPIYREGIARSLHLSGQIEIVAEAEDGAAALDAIIKTDPDVAVVDYRLPRLNGLDIVHAATRDKLRTRVLLLSAVTDSSVVFKAMQEGAAGYLSKDAQRAEILDAVMRISKGHTVIPPELAGHLASEIRMRAKSEAPILTERERQVLRAFAEGDSVPKIASDLFISTSTVKTHVQRLYEKLGVSDRAAAVAVAMRGGLLE
ncbi:response regulator transcription factor [Streptomyces sp. NPDC096030]|uniref:response regulator transcription factor n=1 Tax=Streptomyces sp. NPDC096030 TaxID=3155423 RepID=UPI0033294A58